MLFDYLQSQEISAKDYTFIALLMALIRKADDLNLARLRFAFPEIVAETKARYNAPGGRLPHD